MTFALKRCGLDIDAPSLADIEKFHSKIDQLVVEWGFWPMPRFILSGLEAQNGKQGS